MRGHWLLAALVAAPSSAWAQAPADPLGSPMWTTQAKTFFGDAPVRFDARVKVIFPSIAENQHAFPVAVDARGVPQHVKRILIFADLNPIPLAIDYSPDHAQPYIATRIKLDQRTPVRGAAQLDDGSWLVSGGWVDAAGGGCSAPPASRVRGDWAQHLGEVRGVAIRDGEGTRIRLALRHPMDTGLAANLQAYYLENLALTGAAGQAIGTMYLEAAVSEDPEITVIGDGVVGAPVVLAGRDTNGIEYAGSFTVGSAPRAVAVTLAAR